jgi:hypothetical protein
MKKITAWIACLGFFAFLSCDKPAVTDDFVLTKSTTGGSNGGFGISPDPDATRDTVTTPIYYNEFLAKALLWGLSQNEISYVIGKNIPVSTLYSYNDLHSPSQFIPVADDVSEHPIWKQVNIEFNPGYTPYQFTSSDQINSALHAAPPEIRLVDTDFYFRYTITK